jgi:hypothetical protein
MTDVYPGHWVKVGGCSWCRRPVYSVLKHDNTIEYGCGPGCYAFGRLGPRSPRDSGGDESFSPGSDGYDRALARHIKHINRKVWP